MIVPIVTVLAIVMIRRVRQQIIAQLVAELVKLSQVVAG